MIPSTIGGAHWGGVAVDPVRQIAVVPVNREAFVLQLIPREEYDRSQYQEEDSRLNYNYEYNNITEFNTCSKYLIDYKKYEEFRTKQNCPSSEPTQKHIYFTGFSLEIVGYLMLEHHSST